MDNPFEIINDNEILCLRNKETGAIIATHKPLGTRFVQYKRIKANCNIVQEDDNGFPKNSRKGQANIYCLDDSFSIVWIIKLPIKNDSFPNPIVWNKETVKRKQENDYLILDVQDNPNTFICASWSGHTVTVDYETGKTINIKFTK